MPNAEVSDGRTLLIRDGCVRNVNTKTMEIVSYSARVRDIKQLKRLKPNKLIVHTETKQSKVLQKYFNELFESLKDLSISFFISGPLPSIDRSNNTFSRLFQLYTWLSQRCEKSTSQKYIDYLTCYGIDPSYFKVKAQT